MTVSELIAILQKKDPEAEVVRWASTSNCLDKMREVRTLKLRAYSRKGLLWFQAFDSEEEPRQGTDVGSEEINGVVLE